jgi:phosphate transport system permease protein
VSVRAHLRPSVAARARSSLELSRGDLALKSLCISAGTLVIVALIGLVYEIVHGAAPAFDAYGLSFLGHTTWAPNFSHFGAASMLYGTGVTSAFALVIATPLSIGIGLFLAMLAPAPVRAVIGPLVEMLAAIPSVIVGLWGIIVLAPFLKNNLEPGLHSAFGFLPIFGTPQTTGLSVFTAGIVLAIMILPIVASLSRDLFLTVPPELQDGAAALGATRWEVIRGVVLPTTVSGVAAAIVLGLGRALGEAIAVTQVIGGGSKVHASLFLPGQSLSSQIANDSTNLVSNLQRSALFYLAVILLVFAIVTNVLANMITARFGASRATAA